MSAASAMAEILPVAVRDANENDWPFITDSWEKSLVHNQRARPSRGWYDRLHLRIARLRERGATFKVAFNPRDPGQILGWVCYELPVVHYVFVKQYFRENGVARQLLASFAPYQTVLCSEWTPVLNKISKTHSFIRKVLPC